MNLCLWATVHVGKDEDDFKRIIPNKEVQNIQTVFETGASEDQQRQTP